MATDFVRTSAPAAHFLPALHSGAVVLTDEQLTRQLTGQSRTIYLPAERTGAVIGKNGRMKHLIKVGPKILRLQFDPENKCDFQEILIFDFSDVDFQELMSANILVSHFEKIVCMLIQHSFIGNNGQLCITGGAISPNVLKSPNLTYAISRF